jgi:hypothetical protein
MAEVVVETVDDRDVVAEVEHLVEGIMAWHASLRTIF